MRLSAGRIRSLANRYALAETAAFPGIGTERVSMSRNGKCTAAFRQNHLQLAHQA